MTALEDSYNKYRALGFTLNPTKKDSKHSGKAGAYAERENSKFSAKATGYAAIIPPEIIIVDADTYEEDCEFNKWISDLGYEPVPFALTPSGGTHYAFHNFYPEKVIGKHGYKNLDIYGGFQSVVPIVGTRVLNKQDELANYEWADLDDDFIVNDWDDKFLELFEMKDRGEKNNADYEDAEDDLMVAMQQDPNRKDDGIFIDDKEVDADLAKLPDELEYDDWIEVGMALYDRYKGNDVGCAKFVEFSKRSPKYDPKAKGFEDPKKKWAHGHLIPDKITYKRLANMASEFANNFPKSIEDASTPKELEEVIENISETSKLQTRDKTDGAIRNELAVIVSKKLKDLQKDFPEVTARQPKTIVKDLIHATTAEDLSDALVKAMDEFVMYLFGTKYFIQYKNTLSSELGKANIKDTMKAWGIDLKLQGPAEQMICPIQGVKRETSYLTEDEVTYTLGKSKDPSELEYLNVLTNPLFNAENYDADEEIIDDFFKDIWNGKAEDIIRLIGLTMRFNETKLNKIMLVAPSNSGKTAFAKHIGFQELHMGRLLTAMSGAKGIGMQVINGLKASGFMLIDEVNKALPQEIKNIDDYIYLDQFGQGGTQEIKLHFTLMTSTHKSATRTTSDEMFNRLLQVELTNDEMQHTLSHSAVFKQNTDKYTKVVKGHSLYLLKDALISAKYVKEDLYALQDKYRLEINSDIDDVLYDTGERVIANLKASVGTGSDVVLHNDHYFVKKKSELIGVIEDMLGEIPELDVGKYAEKLVKHFMPSSDRKSVRVGGKSVKYYELHMKSYYATEEEAVVEEFEDLDQPDFE